MRPVTDSCGPALTRRFEDAFVYALHVHAAQRRRGTRTPYISHLMAVAAIVLEHGGDEDLAIAALLHDAVEDAGGRPRLRDIRSRFGDRVAATVEGCTDFGDPDRAYPQRRREYVQHLREASADVRMVALADKVHNASRILADYREEGDALWRRFHGAKDEILSYYESLVEAFRDETGALARELARTIAELLERAQAGRA